MTEQPVYSDEESRWQALLHRDRAAEQAFVYAVQTTGVYCRPGCPSRLPRREHVEFFSDSRGAERVGYRPCRRCRPADEAAADPVVDLMVNACRRLEQEQPPSLSELAAEAGLSPHHFQRRFKKLVGITPKQYARTSQAQRFGKLLRQGGGSVTQAIYEAGFNASSRAYDSARQRLAMAPATYRKGGAGLTIRFACAPCFLGWVAVAMTEHGICAIELGDDRQAVAAQLRHHFPKARLEAAGPEFSAVVAEVIALLEAPPRTVDLPLDIQGTAFQQQVWQVLRQIPPGSTVSYGEVARRLGRPRAVRAVAGACAANKLAVVVPCHRVIGSDGSLSGFRWGIKRKRTLLQRESTATDTAERREAIGPGPVADP
jgi:AraC family transcriptional regulator, regulatory protein of adaptative response / methylated-DNA-[protein]-cysteine methyltransferase